MSNELSPLSSSPFSSGLARQVRRETEAIAARTEVAETLLEARSTLMSSTLNNVSALVMQAEQLSQVAPSAGPYMGLLIQQWVQTTAAQLARFQ